MDPRPAALERSGLERSASGELINPAINPAVSSSSSGSGVGHLVGRIVGHYRVARLIAQGGMGAVYEAHHTRLNRMVALKVMLPGLQASSEDVQRFLREAHAAARLTHPNLVPIYDVGDHHGVRYLAMELVRGDTLHTLIRQRGQLPESLALEIVANSARGLQHAHEQGVLHRDLKPANIIVQSNGTPRVTDFGVAKAIGDQSLTATGTALGTPNYMSPEQAMGLNDELDARTDVYGLGAILYECLTGQPPFNESTHVGTMNAVVNDPPKPPSKLREGLAEAVEAICLKCLRKNPDDRYASAAELVVDIEACLRGRTVRADAAGVWRKFRQRVRRNAVLTGLTGVCLALFLGFVAVLAVPTVHDRRVALFGRRVEAAVAERLEAEASALERARSGGDAEALAACLERLDPVKIAAELLERFARDEPDAAAMLERSLAGLAARLSPLSAQAALALAGHRDGDAQLDLWLRAELLDPDGASGRQARLAQLERLRQVPGASAQLEAELTALSAAPELQTPALLELAGLQAGRWRWAECATLLTGIDEAALDAAGRERLAGLRLALHAFGQGVTLPPYRLVVPLPGPEARLLLLDEQRIRVLGGPCAPDQPPEELFSEDASTFTTTHLLSADLNADGAAEVVFAVWKPEQSQTTIYTYDVKAREGERWRRLVTAAARLADLQVGELDGRPGDDLVFLVRGVSTHLAVYTQEGSTNHSLEGVSSWFTQALALQDIDGDGVDEVAVATTRDPAGVLLYRYDGKDMTRLGDALELGRVTALQPQRLPDGTPGLLATVDVVGDDFDRGGGGDRPAWWGRDGLFLVAWTADGPRLAARWTQGADATPAGREQADRVREVRGWGFEQDGQPWVARLARIDGQRLLELAPLEALGPGGLPTPTLRLPLTCEWSSFDPRVPALDLDGDGRPERLIGQAAGPLGDPVPQRWTPPPPAPATPVDVLQRQVARLLALEAFELAEARIEALAALSAPGATEARLAWVEATRARAAQEEVLAQRAFDADDAERGRALREASLARSSRAAEAAARVAQDPAVGARARFAAWELAAQAFLRACAEERALEVLTDATDSGLPSALATTYLARRRELEGWSQLARAALCQTKTAALCNSLYLVRRDGDALRIRCEGDTEAWVGTPLGLRESQPLVLETSVELLAGAWTGSLELGLLAPRDELASSASARELLAGFAFQLWDVETGAPSVRVQAGPHQRRLRLRGFPQRVRLRLELFPLGDGTRISHWLWIGDELVHSAIDDRPRVELPAHVLLAARSGRYPGDARVSVPEHYARGAWVRIDDLSLYTARPTEALGQLSSVLLIEATHGALLNAQTDLANRGYQTLLGAGATDEEFVEGCLGAEAGGSTTRQWILEALNRDPSLTLARLEQAAEALDDRPTLLARIRAQLDEAGRSEDEAVRLAADSLRGEHRHAIPPSLTKGYSDVPTELHRAQVRAWSMARTEQVQSNMNRFPESEWVRLPWVRRIPRADPLGPQELAQLTGEVAAHCRECQQQLLARQAATATDVPGLRQLAQGYRHMGYEGEWEQTLLRLLPQADEALARELWLELAAHHLRSGHLRRVEHDVEQLAARQAPATALAPYREALGPERFDRAVARGERARGG